MDKKYESPEEQDRLLRSIIDLFVYNNCDYFIYLDVKRNSYTMFSGSQSGTPLPPAECLDYSTELVKYANDFVVPEDREHVIREMGLDRVVEELEKSGTHVIYCGVEDPIRGYTRKRLEYRYYDRGQQMVLLSRTDLTDLYLEQQRQNKALQEALKAAEEAGRLKNMFFSNMSHDIRTPMNAIVGFATLLEKEADHPERVRAYTEKILSSSRLLLSLLNDVLDISQIESGKTTVNISEIHVQELVDELDTMIRPLAKENNQEFKVQIEKTENDILLGDKIRIMQILMNILNNAVKYTPAGGRIELGIRREPQRLCGCENVVFTVKDTGIGISPEFKKDIFEPFSRESNETVDKIQGTGLGLAITKNIVDMLGGEIMVDSNAGTGSTFTVVLPLKTAGAGNILPDKEMKKKKTGQEQVEKQPLKGIRILAAEDNELNAEILSEFLCMAGAECEVVSDGSKALNRFQELLPDGCDVILMDVSMPVMDGMEAVRRIRALDFEKARTVPIIALTANAFTEDIGKVLAAGMNAHLAKPVDIKQLYRTIREYVGRG